MIKTKGPHTVTVGAFKFTFSRRPNVAELDEHFALVSRYRMKRKGGELEPMPEAASEGAAYLCGLFDSLAVGVSGLRRRGGDEITADDPGWAGAVPPDVKLGAIARLNRWERATATVNVYADAREIANEIDEDGVTVKVSMLLRDPTHEQMTEYNRARRLHTLGPLTRGYSGWYAAASKLFGLMLIEAKGYDSADIPAEHQWAAVQAYLAAVDELLEN